MTTHETLQLQKVKEIALKNQWTFIDEPLTKFCAKLITNKNTYFLIGAELGINSSGSNRVCNDKAFTDFFLNLNELKTIPTKSIYKNDIEISESEFPIIVKPNTGWGGKGVTLVYTNDELKKSIKIAKKYSDVVLLQKYIELNEYRILVFNNKVYFAYKREIPKIVGNGKSNYS